MSNEQENLGLALINSIGSEHLEELGISLADVLIDSIDNADVISEIPIVGLLFKGRNALLAIRDRIFLKKIYDFLYEHKNIPLVDRTNFLSKFETEKDLRAFGENVVILLDSLNNLTKAALIGKLSRARILENITQQEFSILSESISRLFILDIEYLLDIAQNHEGIVAGSPKDSAEINLNLVGERLIACGLMSTGGNAAAGQEYFGFDKKINRFGYLFISIIQKY